MSFDAQVLLFSTTCQGSQAILYLMKDKISYCGSGAYLREEVDVNCQLNCQHGINVETPLEGLCDMWADLGRKPRLQYDLARLYLSFGAGAIEQAKNSLEWFLQEEAEDHNAEHNDCCRELIVLLTDTQKMRGAEEH